VGDQHGGESQLAPDRQEGGLEVGPRDRVQCPERLVQQHDFGTERQRARHRDSLPLAAGQVPGPTPRERLGLEPHQPQRGARLRFSVRLAPQPGYQSHVPENPPVGQEAALLRHIPDGAAEEHRISPGHIGASNQHLPLVRMGEPVEAAQQRGLARAALADQGHALPRRDLERDSVERGDRTEPFRDGDGLERGRTGLGHGEKKDAPVPPRQGRVAVHSTRPLERRTAGRLVHQRARPAPGARVSSSTGR
jgi:hypothetical protein